MAWLIEALVPGVGLFRVLRGLGVIDIKARDRIPGFKEILGFEGRFLWGLSWLFGA